MQLQNFAGRYSDIAFIKEYAHIGCGSAKLDGWFYPTELRKLADFLEKVEIDFYNWYKEVCKFDDQLEEEPVNCYWHDFCEQKTPLESYNIHGKIYGRKNYE